MSGYNYSNLDPYEDEQETGSGLRKMLEDALKREKELVSRLDRLERQAPVQALLKEKGIDPKVAEIMPQDVDPSEWLDKYASLFGKPLDQAEVTDPPEVVVAPDLLAEQQAQAQMQPSGDAAGNTTQQQDPIQKLKSFTTEAEMLTFLNSERSGGAVSGGGLFG